MTLIVSNDHLHAFLKKIKGADYIAIDTEFIRDHYYYPKLCLIQIAHGDEYAAIDPLAEGIDLKPFYALLADPNICKVFHAARQDVEIFFHDTHAIPTPLFDTQIAAMVCGFGESVSYAKLVQQICGVELDKSSRFTDWSKRPLSDKQIDYALSDVTYLCKAYDFLKRQLETSGRHSWLAEEIEVLLSPDTYQVTPEDAWKKIKTRNHNRRFLNILQVLAQWRETKAQQSNKPRGHILKDNVLLEIAAVNPISLTEFKRVRGIGKMPTEYKEEMIKALDTIRTLSDRKLHKLFKKRSAAVNKDKALYDLLKVLLSHKSEHYGVAEKLLASSDDLSLIASDENLDDIPAMHGWRKDVFGKDAIALKRGDLAITAYEGDIRLIRLEQPPFAHEF